MMQVLVVALDESTRTTFIMVMPTAFDDGPSMVTVLLVVVQAVAALDESSTIMVVPAALDESMMDSERRWLCLRHATMVVPAAPPTRRLPP